MVAPLAGIGAIVATGLGFFCLGGTGPYLANHWGAAYGVGLAAVVGVCLTEAGLRTLRGRVPPDRYSGLDRATEYLGLLGVVAVIMTVGAWFGLPMAHGGSAMIYNGRPVVWDHGPVRSLTLAAYRRMNIEDQALFLFPTAAALVAAGYVSRGLMFRPRRAAEETPVPRADPPFEELARRLHDTVSSPPSRPAR